jgi:succinate-acetate transporter protein
VSDFAHVGGNGDDNRLDPPVQITLRPLASPLPIGFFAFAIGSVLFSTLELGWVSQTQLPVLATIMLVFVAPIQLIASMFAFWARDAGGATALGLLGMTWAVVGVTSLTSPSPRSPMLGAFMLCMSAVIAAFAGVSIFGKPVLSAVGALAGARFLVTGIYQIEGWTGWEHASGWIGLPLSAVAFYLALALMIEDAQHRTVLPLLRRGEARTAIESHLRDQVASIEREAGVRGQL